MVLEKTLESPLKSKAIKPVYLKGNQPLMLFGRTHAEAPILWPLDVRSWLTGKDHDAGKDWMTEDEIVGRHHRFNGYEHGQTLGNGEGLGSMECCNPWGCEKVRHDLATGQQQHGSQWTWGHNRATFLSGDYQRESISFPSWASEATCLPCLLTPSLVCKARHVTYLLQFFCSHICHCLQVAKVIQF